MRFEKVETSALIMLFLGVFLLAFTFFSAYSFLIAPLTILASSDLTELFGRALAPLIEAVIRILFLGVMGWVGSILTIRAVQLLKKDKEPTPTPSQSKPETRQTNPQPTEVAPPSPKAQIDDAEKPKAAKTAPAETPPTPETPQPDKPAK